MLNRMWSARPSLLEVAGILAVLGVLLLVAPGWLLPAAVGFLLYAAAVAWWASRTGSEPRR